MTLLDLGAVTVAGYRVRTGDSDTEASAVTGALVDAERLIEDELRRNIPLEERAEKMRIRDHYGRMYPKAWPITLCTSNAIEGNRILLGGVPDLAQFTALISTQLPLYSTVTYTGGFDADTLPIILRDAVYDLARGLIGDPAPVPIGATSVSVGDVSVALASPNSGPVDAYLPGLSKRIAQFKNRWV